MCVQGIYVFKPTVKHLNLFFMFYSSLAFPVVEQELSPCFCLLNYVQSSEVPATVKIVVDDATK